MTFVAVIKAEPGWKAAFAESNGSISYVDIKEWGVKYIVGLSFNRLADISFVPIDPISGDDFSKKDMFLAIIDPNCPDALDPERLSQMAARAVERKCLRGHAITTMV